MNQHAGVRLSRDGRPAPPVRLVHLGLGDFFRAHPAWYTANAPGEWGIAGFTSRAALVDDLNAQDGLYTLVSRGSDRDRHEVVGSLARAHAAGEHGEWLGYFENPAVAAVTLTITEAVYVRAADRPEVAAELEALRAIRSRSSRATTSPATGRSWRAWCARRRSARCASCSAGSTSPFRS